VYICRESYIIKYERLLILESLCIDYFHVNMPLSEKSALIVLFHVLHLDKCRWLDNSIWLKYQEGIVKLN
jgi:hypothetical protein